MKVFLSKSRLSYASASYQLLLRVTLVEPRPRASDTIMNCSSEFIFEEPVLSSSHMKWDLRKDR